MEGLSMFRVSTIALSFLILCQWTPAVGETGKSDDKVSVLFSYNAPDARRVCISGSFNRWSKTSHCLTKNGETWSVEIRLSPGKYSYLFVIDDRRWEVDPEAPLREQSDFGMENSVLIVQ
jgi:1,4-alpha-glucan branching enzyme